MSPFPRPTLPDPGGWAAGVVPSPPRYRPRWWLHAVLFALTALSTTFFGALFAGWIPEELAREGLGPMVRSPVFWTEGLKFSVPLLAILLAHEMGHYLAARRHGLVVTPPFFIPVPFGIGTLGAVIRIREPIRDKAQLLDVGAAGPLAGFAVTLPFLVAGVAASRVTELTPRPGMLLFQEPLAFLAARTLAHPGLGPEQDLLLHPTGFAAWFGLLVTALNLLPFGQLDGGHVAYAMFGHRHRRAVWPLWVLLFLLGFRWMGWWIWAVIALVMGVRHPPMWDEAYPLDPRRRRIGWVALAVFVLCFVPQPVTVVAAVPW